MTKRFFAPLVLLLITTWPPQSHSDNLAFDSNRWEFKSSENQVIQHLGRQSLYLKGGFAIVKDSRFTDGILEYDIAFGPERGFMGAFWRMQDPGNYEEFYVRPHQSGNPDANQYQPVFYQTASWQLYHGEGYGAPVQYKFNEWNHIKIVVSGKQAEVYINDLSVPALFVNEQKREIKEGNVGLYSSDFSPAYYSNFTFTSMNAPALKGKAKPAEPAPAGTVMFWHVSNTLAAKSLENKHFLGAAEKQHLSWSRLEAETTGITNLARLHPWGEEKNALFARLNIESDQEQIKKFQFGFSDNVKVYLNDRLIYAGSDPYRSRDYRFLGTMGLYDELYLPLNKGKNELWMAVTEDFGGWGVKAMFEDMNGIALK